MRILFDITHPAHLYFFNHAVRRLRSEGHEVLLTGREKDCLVELARELDFEMEIFGDAPRGMTAMAKTLLSRQWRLASIVRRFRPNVMAAIGGTFIGFVGWLARTPCVVFTDTESATLSNAITFPFATRICTPKSYARADHPRQIRYRGYHSCAYLHPQVFQPNRAFLDPLGLSADEPYSIVRFVSWEASHDLGRAGLSLADKLVIVEQLAACGRVFVSTEGPMPASLERYRLPLARSHIHHALAFASLLVGESSTMCKEAALLGTPSIFIYPRVDLGCIRELADRGIVHWFAPTESSNAANKGVQLLRERDSTRWKALGQAIVADCDDVTRVICDQMLACGRGS